MSEEKKPADEVGQKRAARTTAPKVLTPTQSILLEVQDERNAQDETWGIQRHPQTGGANPQKAREHFETEANMWKKFNEARVEAGVLGFDGILLEEVYEAICESDPVKRRAELVQVAAVAVVMIEALDDPSEPASAAVAA